MTTTIDELADRLRLVESQVEGEKDVSLAILQQGVRHAELMAALRIDAGRIGQLVDNLLLDASSIKAEQRNHGTHLTILRQEVIVLRKAIKEVNERIDTLETNLNAKLDAILAAVQR